MTLLAAFQALLAPLHRPGRHRVGTPIAGRAPAELEALIGFFVNTLVLRADLAGDPTLPRAARRGCATSRSGAYAHQDLPVRAAGRGAAAGARPEPHARCSR